MLLQRDPYRKIFERFPHPSWVVDRATLRFLAVNDAAVARFGYTRDAFLGMTYLDCFPAGEAPAVRRTMKQHASSRSAMHWRMRSKKGALVDVEVTWRHVPFDRAPATLITAQSAPKEPRRVVRRTEEGRVQLEALTRRLVEVQEAERSKISRELHDEIGQLLTGLKLMITASVQGESRRNGGSDAASPQRAEMVQIVNELIGRLRNLSMNLRPPMLDELGLVAALRWHFERYTTRTQVRVSFRNSVGEARFSPAVETAAFRTIQEALTNTARHSGVDTVEVELRADQKTLTLRVEDAGAGFNQESAPAGRSSGLSGMRERAVLLGGHLTVESALDAGTRITTELPLRDPSEVCEES